jgi:hypothetical protein
VIDYLNTVAEISKERKKYFQNYKYYAKLIKNALDLPDVEVLVFGSVLDGAYTMASDIDILVISDGIPRGLNERAKILTKINEALGYLHPFELHLVTKRESEWYKKIIGDYEKI